MYRLAPILCLAVAAALMAAPAGKKKKKNKGEEEITQVLELPKEPPAAVVADSDRLVFQVSPLSSKGLMSQQLRDALKWLLRQDRTVVRLRAFVAGTGDTRRVQSIVSDMFTEKKLALPSLSVVQIGALPQEGAQVLLESAALDRKPVNPGGLAFLSGQSAYDAEPLQPVLPLAEQAAARLAAALKSASLGPDDVLRVGCYVTSLDDIDKVRAAIAAQFPRASLTLVQPLRGALQSGASCDAVARLTAPPREPLAFIAGTPESSAVALVGPRRIALTGAQIAFGSTAGDARLAFERLGKSLEQVSASYDTAAVVQIYSLSRASAGMAEKAGAGFFGKTGHPPAVTALPFEGLPSMDASFAVDVIALVPESK
ncbi:MAG: hypothetical protein ACM336_13055 [Acidobacteriota bacterium]